MQAFFRVFGFAALTLLALAAPAFAHPHIFIDAKATIVFDDEGRVSAIKNAWTFDEAFSVWQIQGLDTNGDGVTSSEEMQELADENLKGLADYGFYTSAGEGKSSIEFVPNNDAKFVFENNRSTLTFSISPTEPYKISDTLEMSIADPEYYVAITFNADSDVQLENAPAGCAASLKPGHDMPDDLAAKLFAIPADVTKLPPDLEIALRGVQGSILVNCPAGGVAAPKPEAKTALDAVTQLAEAKPIPFGGPPPEPGLILPRTGFLGWVAKMQSDFYQAMTATLADLKHDYTAFWLLGGLSFLYGIFHAAGPGHGKVVISSYVLANEAQARRGIWLSFWSSMLSSLVAVVFIGIAAAILGLSAIAMGEMANWIGIASYGLVALLGLWLIIRKLFGFGHDHRPRRPSRDMRAAAFEHLHGEPAAATSAHALSLGRNSFAFRPPAAALVGGGSIDAYGRAPGHAHYGHDHGDDEHGHSHVAVMPDQARGDWREQLGVVIGVGLRPCSGALIVLVFALSQGILLAGIASVFLMGLGTFITVSALATLAVTAKGLAQRWMGRENRWTGILLWWAELLGAVLVFLFGVVLVLASI